MSEFNENKAINILDDICEITTIPNASMHKLFDKIGFCIANAIYEGYLNKQQIIEVNIGLGTIIVSIDSNQLVYKFVPSCKLEKNIVDSIRNNKNPLDIKLEETFVNRILNTYKDML